MPYSHPQPINRANALREVRHLLPGALVFAGLGGYVNAVALGFFLTPVSHMTGAISHLGVDLAEGRGADAFASVSIVVGFVIGAILAGMTIGARKLMPGRRYGAALIAEGLLLGGATVLLLGRHRLGLPLVAVACGLQNAMTSSYCGLLIRSTHVTGTVTDIGVMIGHWIRHRKIETWKLGFLSAVVLAFGTGGFFGAWLDLRFGPRCLAVGSVGCVVAGVGLWIAVRRGWLRPAAVAGSGPRTASFPNL
ncbi:MAG: DUF1275 domain-containing protein [Burkholderiales bacterium]|nr:DUF1275 domain-containing protein [Opitutaceae bacterium]